MKKTRKSKQLIDELKQTPNLSFCCDKVGISRQSLYRWMKDDKDFKNDVEEALNIGTEAINDLAESKLIHKIQMGDFHSIKFWLESNKKKYVRPRPKDFWDKIESSEKIDEIKITVVHTEHSKAKEKDYKEIGFPNRDLE